MESPTFVFVFFRTCRLMTLILGIDPGSRITGFGVVRDTGRGCVYVASGCIRTGAGELHEGGDFGEELIRRHAGGTPGC